MSLLPPIGVPSGNQPLMPEDRGAKASSKSAPFPELPIGSGTEITPERVIANSRSLIERKSELPSHLAEMSEIVSKSDGHLPMGPFVHTAGQLGDIGISYLSALLTRASEE